MKHSPITISPMLRKEIKMKSCQRSQSTVLHSLAEFDKKTAPANLVSSASEPAVYTGQPPEPYPQYQHSLFASSPTAYTAQSALSGFHPEAASTVPSIPLLTPDGNIREADLHHNESR